MKKLQNLLEDNLLFIDIETVRCEKELTEQSSMYEAWKYKMRYTNELNKKLGDDITLEESFDSKAALYAPFAKIVCITIGKITTENEQSKIKLFSIYGKDEKELLRKFNDLIFKLYEKNKNLLYVGFNSKQFDLPFIFKRCIVNGVRPHISLDKGDLKPWEINDIDLAELWKGTSFYQDSLVSIVSALGFESPKSDIDGSETSNVYWNEDNGCKRIAKYCEKDVVATINVFKKFKFESIITEVISNITD